MPGTDVYDSPQHPAAFLPNASNNNNMGNITGNGTLQENCGTEIPTALQLIAMVSQHQLPMILLTVYCVLTVLTLALYTEHVVFIMKHFKLDMLARRQRTIWLIGLFPVYSIAGVTGFVVPRAACIVDLVANTYMGACLYMFLSLMVNYLGGPERMWEVVSSRGGVFVQFNTLPFCCICPCLPKRRLDRKMFYRLRAIVLQVSIFRPFIMFVAAVLWTDGWYEHGTMEYYSSGMYITIANIITTLIAVYGLNLTKSVFSNILRRFRVKGKMLAVQMVLVTSAVAAPTINVFVAYGFIRCSPLTTQKGEGDAIYRGVLIVSMFCYSLMGRFLFRRDKDAVGYAEVLNLKEDVLGAKEDLLVPMLHQNSQLNLNHNHIPVDFVCVACRENWRQTQGKLNSSSINGRESTVPVMTVIPTIPLPPSSSSSSQILRNGHLKKVPEKETPRSAAPGAMFHDLSAKPSDYVVGVTTLEDWELGDVIADNRVVLPEEISSDSHV